MSTQAISPTSPPPAETVAVEPVVIAPVDPAPVPSAPVATAPVPTVVEPRHRSAGGVTSAILLFLIYTAVAAAAVWGGVRVRCWVWDYAQPIRQKDIHNAFIWGSYGVQHGPLNAYRYIASENIKDVTPADASDCPPLQLLVLTQWAGWARSHFSNLTEGGYAAVAPLLRFNMGMELLGAIGAFLLARHWVVRSRPLGQPRRFFDGWTAGMIAALLLWFNPALLTSSHGWPTFDVWVIPFILWATLIACWERWFWAGVVLGIGAMLKAQVLFAVPVFVLWPLFAGKPRQMLGVIVGTIFAIALTVSPWMLTSIPKADSPDIRSLDRPATLWVAGVTLSAILLLAMIRIPLLRKRPAAPAPTDAAPVTPTDAPPLAAPVAAEPEGVSTAHLIWWSIIMLVAVAAVVWPFFRIENRWLLPAGLNGAAALIVGTLLSRRRQPMVLCAAIGIALLLCIPMFHSSSEWFRGSIGSGLYTSADDTRGASNLPAMLGIHYRIAGYDNLFTIPATLNLGHGVRPIHWLPDALPVSAGELLFTIYAFALLVSTIGMAIQYRRNDARFLVAATAPWLLLFCLHPGATEHYLLYAVAMGCTLTAVSVGMTLLDLFLTAAAWAMLLHTMLQRSNNPGDFAANITPGFGNRVLQFVAGTHPDLAWPLLLCAAIFLYVGVAARRKRSLV